MNAEFMYNEAPNHFQNNWNDSERNDTAVMIKALVHRNMMQKRKNRREVAVGSKRKQMLEQLDFEIWSEVMQVLRNMEQQNENECPRIYPEELEAIIDRIAEQKFLDEDQYYQEMAEMIDKEEKELCEYYAELEDQLPVDDFYRLNINENNNNNYNNNYYNQQQQQYSQNFEKNDNQYSSQIQTFNQQQQGYCFFD